MRVIVVCPTARGGHIEHAANLSAAFSRAGDDVTLVSRPGSARYLPPKATELFRIAEVLYPLRRAAGLRRVADRAAVLSHEHLTLRRLIHDTEEPTLVVLEEPRYPSPRVLRGRRSDVALACFIHNVVEHSTHGGATSTVDRAREAVKRASLRQYDALVVHGRNQARKLSAHGPLPVVTAQLPAHGWVERSWHAQATAAAGPPIDLVCLGELRRNKGVHIAVQAARSAGRRLLVAGQPVDAGYRHELAALAERTDAITILDRFLEPVEFESFLRSARAVVLPYVGFDAQSGVLARAVAAGTPVIASDIPSLREQAAGSRLVDFVPVGDVRTLAKTMTEVAGRASANDNRNVYGQASDDEWHTITDQIRAATGARLDRAG
jgi:glycosyltransferase involved in cell wall biosynthesis